MKGLILAGGMSSPLLLSYRTKATIPIADSLIGIYNNPEIKI